MKPNRVRPARFTRLAQSSVLLVMLLCLSGCGALRPGPAGALTLRGAYEPERTLPTGFDTAIYGFDSPDSVTVVLVQGPVDEPERAMTMRLFWEPRAGRTPLTRDATNTMVRYAHFHTTEDGERRVRVYSGAGFVRPRTDAGRTPLRATVREATLRLIDVTAEQPDTPDTPDTPIEVTLAGRFTAERDDVATLSTVRRIEAAVSETLSYPRFVREDAHEMSKR